MLANYVFVEVGSLAVYYLPRMENSLRDSVLPNGPLCNGLICILSANLAHPCKSGAVVG